jgi:hypothetical protein
MYCWLVFLHHKASRKGPSNYTHHGGRGFFLKKRRHRNAIPYEHSLPFAALWTVGGASNQVLRHFTIQGRYIICWLSSRMRCGWLVVRTRVSAEKFRGLSANKRTPLKSPSSITLNELSASSGCFRRLSAQLAWHSPTPSYWYRCLPRVANNKSWTPSLVSSTCAGIGWRTLSWIVYAQHELR